MRRFWLAVAAVVVSAGLMGGQDAPQTADQNNPPQVSDALVAHISAISGSVSTQRGDTSEWTAATMNAPLVSGDKVAAGAGGRAEVQIDYADLLRLGDNAQANLVNLSKSQIQIQMASGLADYVVLKGAQASTEIDTPNISIRPQGAAVVRIQIPSDSETEVVVRKGNVDISTPQGSTTLHEGQLITVQGTDTPEYKISDAPNVDSWDQWNQQRDNAVLNSASVRNTSPYYTGAQDLDNYGYWTVVPGYGQVWVPNNQDGWTPYSDGRWDWEPYWGWTWVGYEPWGWAPYHYGRWFVYGPRWVWWPGPVSPYYRPVWAPAYVSFFGWGGGFGVGVGFGHIGWLPIGPCDSFRPWWGGGRGFERVNINNFNGRFNDRGGRVIAPLARVSQGRVVYSNLNSMRTDARVRAAIIRVPSNEFGRGAISTREHVTAGDLRSGSVIGGRLPVTPTRASLGSERRVSPSALPQHAATHFFGNAHAVARPAFGAEQARVQPRAAARVAAPAAEGSARPANGFRHFEASGNLRTQAHSPEVGPRNESRPAAPAAQPRAGFQRFGGSAAAPSSNRAPSQDMHPFTPQARPPQPNSQPGARPGWQRFQPGTGAESRGGNQSFSRGDMQPRESRPPLSVGHSIVSQPRSEPYRPAYSRPEMSRPNYSRPEASRPEVSRPDVSRPEMSRPSGGGAPRASAAPRSSGGGGGHPGGGGHRH